MGCSIGRLGRGAGRQGGRPACRKGRKQSSRGVEKERVIQEFRGWGPLKDTPFKLCTKTS